MQRNKVYSVTVIAAVAEQLGVEEDLLHDLSIGLEREDGVIRVFGLGEDSIMAFTDDGCGFRADPATHSDLMPPPGPI